MKLETRLEAPIPATEKMVVPGYHLPHGYLGEFIWQEYQDIKRDQFQDNEFLKLSFDSKTRQLISSNFWDVTIVDEILRKHGFESVDLKDLSNPQVKRLIEGKHYVDAPGKLVVRSSTDVDNLRNNSLARSLVDRLGIEEAELRKRPALVRDLRVVSWPKDKEGYQLGVAPISGEELQFIQDERFTSKYNGWYFTEVDENGIPSDLNQTRQSENDKKWYTRINDEGVSGLYLGEGLGLDSVWRGLAISNSGGRVVVKCGEATQNFEERIIQFRNRQQKQLRDYIVGLDKLEKEIRAERVRISQ